MSHLCIVDRIEPTGTEGMFKAYLGVRSKPTDGFHGLAIEVTGKNLTECVQRTHVVLMAFNKE